MNKMYTLTAAFALSILLWGLNIVADDQNPVVEKQHDKPSLFDVEKKDNEQESPKEFPKVGEYRYKKIENLKEELRKNPKTSVQEVLERHKDDSIVRQDLCSASEAHRDETLVEMAFNARDKEKECTQWLDRGLGFAVGAGTFAVSIALYYLLQRKPDNQEVVALIQNLNGLLQRLPPAPQQNN